MSALDDWFDHLCRPWTVLPNMQAEIKRLQKTPHPFDADGAPTE